MYWNKLRILTAVSAVIALLMGMQSTVIAAIEPKVDPGIDGTGIILGLPAEIELQPAYLIRTFDTNNSVWNPSSPDPSGIDYLPWLNQFIFVDSEVEEMVWYAGANVYLSTTSGNLVSTCTTNTINPWSKEPTGIAVNPGNRHYFFSDDQWYRLTELDPGPDEILCTMDDNHWQLNIPNYDIEDITFGNNTLYIGGGADKKIYILPLGSDGILNTSDDGTMTSFDTGAMGFSDVEGIAFNETTSTLFVTSTKGVENYLGEFTLTGELIYGWDLSFMGTVPNIRSGLTFAPASDGSAVDHLYIVSRGVDNDTTFEGVEKDPYENDGKVWEISLTEPAPTVTPSPTTETPSPTTDTPSPTTETPSPTTDTPSPTTETPSPTTDTPSPTTETPSPTTDTPSPTTETPSPTTETPSPTTDTPSPTTETPSPTTDTPSPTTVTPTPTVWKVFLPLLFR